MFKKIIEKLQGLSRGGSAIDPTRFNDPLAEQVDWSPAKGGGASFRTHKLVMVNPGRLEFQVTTGAKLFYLIFIVVGLGIVTGFSVATYSTGNFVFNLDVVMPLLIGCIFAIVGSALMYFGTTPVVFDSRRGFFWKGRKSPNQVFDRKKLKLFAEFENIHALQLISEYCRGDKSSFYSYELNLVLKNGERINVVDHGNKEILRQDAATLSAFLNKPVWDAL